MRYQCQLTSQLKVAQGVTVQFALNLEVALPCPHCRRTARTLVLSPTKPSQHWGSSEITHIFQGTVRSRECEGGIARYLLEYEYEPFVDSKYPERQVTPQPTWGRVSFITHCPCGARREHQTQSNLGSPGSVNCPCGRLLYEDVIPYLEFSPAQLLSEPGR